MWMCNKSDLQTYLVGGCATSVINHISATRILNHPFVTYTDISTRQHVTHIIVTRRFKNGGRGWDNPMKAAKSPAAGKGEVRSELKTPDQVRCTSLRSGSVGISIDPIHAHVENNKLSRTIH